MTASGEGYITRKAGPVVPVDVALYELLNKMRWLREKSVPHKYNARATTRPTISLTNYFFYKDKIKIRNF